MALRLASSTALAIFMLAATPALPPVGALMATPARAEGALIDRMQDIGRHITGLDFQDWSLGLVDQTRLLLAPTSMGACTLGIFCRSTLSGLSRLTRGIARTTGRAARTTARTTTRVVRTTARVTSRVARTALRTTTKVAAGMVAGVAMVAAGAASATGLVIPPRTRRHVELAVSGLREADLARLARRGYLIVHRRDSSLLGKHVARIRAPEGTSRIAARREAAQLAPGSTVADNDMFIRPTPGAYRLAGRDCGKSCETFDVKPWLSQTSRVCSSGVRIGVVDTGVDLEHSSFQDARITVHTARSVDLPESDKEHGTAVVSLLVGRPGTAVEGLVPDAHIFAVDAFHGTGKTSGADAYDLVVALDWLAEQNVSIVNLSLSGPDNPLLKEVVERLQRRGIVVVAASGRPTSGDGGVGYPAKYRDVVAVSAIDSRLRPSRLALRGDHISFSAPGVGVIVAGAGDTTRKVDGTSFAAPFVTAAYAIGTHQTSEVGNITDRLVASARDLGPPGRDPVFGWGLVQFPAQPDCHRK